MQKKDEAILSEAALLKRSAALGVDIPAEQISGVLAGARRLAAACKLLREFEAADSVSSRAP